MVGFVRVGAASPLSRKEEGRGVRENGLVGAPSSLSLLPHGKKLGTLPAFACEAVPC